MLYISLSVVIIKKVNNFHKTKQIQYAESKFDNFKFVICKFNFASKRSALVNMMIQFEINKFDLETGYLNIIMSRL